MAEHRLVDHASLESEDSALGLGGGEHRMRPGDGRLVGTIGRPDRRHLVRMDAGRRREAGRGSVDSLVSEPVCILEVDVHRVDRGLAVRPGFEENASAGVAGDVAIAAVRVP